MVQVLLYDIVMKATGVSTTMVRLEVAEAQRCVELGPTGLLVADRTMSGRAHALTGSFA
jgi:hypothetical protein